MRIVRIVRIDIINCLVFFLLLDQDRFLDWECGWMCGFEWDDCCSVGGRSNGWRRNNSGWCERPNSRTFWRGCGADGVHFDWNWRRVGGVKVAGGGGGMVGRRSHNDGHRADVGVIAGEERAGVVNCYQTRAGCLGSHQGDSFEHQQLIGCCGSRCDSHCSPSAQCRGGKNVAMQKRQQVREWDEGLGVWRAGDCGRLNIVCV